MANERAAQERLEFVNKALEKSQRVGNFEGTPILDRQLNGFGELSVGEHIEKLLTIGERREAIRIRIDNEAIPKLERQKLEVERQLVLDSQPESPNTSNTTESSVLPEPFDPENPRGLTLVEAAVLAVLINDRIEKGVITDEKDIELFNDDDYKKAYEKIMERRRSLPPINEEDLLAIREEIFSGLAETVRNNKFDDVSEKTEDDNVRTLLLYITVFQSNHTDDVLLEKILETKGIAYEVDRGGEPHNLRPLSNADSSANRVLAQSEVQTSVEEGALGTQSQIVEPDGDPDEELLPDDEVVDAFLTIMQGVLPGEESIEVDHQPVVEEDQDQGEDEEWLRLLAEEEQEGLGMVEEPEDDVSPLVDESTTNVNTLDSAALGKEHKIDPDFERKAQLAVTAVLEANLHENINWGVMMAVHGPIVGRIIDRLISRRLIKPQGHGRGQTFSREDFGMVTYVVKFHQVPDKKQAGSLRTMVTDEISRRQQNGGK